MENQKDNVKFIVVDTNVLVGDFFLRSPSSQLLRVYVANSKAILAVPRLVIEEACNEYDEQFREAKHSLRDSLAKLKRFLLEAPSYPNREMEEAHIDYKDYLEGALASMNAQFMEYGEIPHTDIVQRALGRKKPFKASGAGYRDALIWETITRQCVDKNGITLFITRNKKDFCGPDNLLHKDLQSELLRKGFDRDSVRVVSGLDEFTSEYVVPYLKSRKEFVPLIQNYEFEGLNLQEVCEENVFALLTAIDENPSSLIHNPDVYEPEIDEIHIPREMTVKEASEISDKLLLVIFEFIAPVTFIYYLSRDEYVVMSDTASEDIHVLDWHWNDYTLRVSRTTEVSFSCALTFDTESRIVESFQVESVSGIEE